MVMLWNGMGGAWVYHFMLNYRMLWSELREMFRMLDSKFEGFW